MSSHRTTWSSPTISSHPLPDQVSTALVTGAARGIGAATARRLSADGHRLVLVDRCSDDPRLDYALGTRAELSALADEIGAVDIEGDVSSSAVCERAVAAAVDVGGSLDIVVAGAGVMAGGVPLWELSDTAFTAMHETNVLGTLALVRAAIPAMLAQPEPRRGRFVAIASAVTCKATPSLGGYAATKAAVTSLVSSLAADLADTGITANVVSPGSTATDLLDYSARVYGLTNADEFAQHHINRQLVGPDQLADAIAWLSSPQADAVTGIVLPVDAGMSAK